MSICATPTARFPDGRTGLDAGYQAHRRARDQVCEPCAQAHLLKCRQRWAEMTPEQRVARRAANAAETRRYRELNPEGARRAKVTYMGLNKSLMRAAKDTACADCGVAYSYWVMQFDHTGDDKLFNIGVIGPTASRAKLIAEIAKCDVVCANCHAERTHRRRLARSQDEAV